MEVEVVVAIMEAVAIPQVTLTRVEPVAASIMEAAVRVSVQLEELEVIAISVPMLE